MNPPHHQSRIADRGARSVTRSAQLQVVVTALMLAVLVLYGSAPTYAQDWPAIARELEAMFEADQAALREWNALTSPTEGVGKSTQVDEAQRAALRVRLQAMDKAHQTRLTAIIAAHGWPRRSDVGGRATMAAFTILQHAPLEFQRKVFADVQRAAANDEIDRTALATLEDRIRIYEKRPQRYGTQVEIRNGGVTLWPVEDPSGLDARRREVGLMPICSYLALLATPPAKVQYSTCATVPGNEPQKTSGATR